MWAARLEPGVLEAFSTLWRTDELLVSFDTLNITLPNRKDQERRKPWEHIDQSPLRRGIHCVQGIICLSPAGPEDGGLVVFPGSHNVNEEFFYGSEVAASRRKEWLPMRDVYLFNQDELDWFHTRGLRPHKVCAEPGDLILWDSRTIHYGAEPTERSSQIRTAIYAAYTPARFASKEQLELKKRIFENYGATSHWPHEQIVVKPREVYLPDGTRDPRDRDEPLEKPVLSDRLLQLAGIKSY
jgi:ectoine hydroxylase-related dioxygenase (phytanoyl-CoA dioxygenase family)